MKPREKLVNKRLPMSLLDLPEVERWLSEQAAQGLLLARCDSRRFRFRQEVPRPGRRYHLCPTKDSNAEAPQELVDLYPGMSAKEREYEIVKKHGAVFLMQIGDILSNGEKHDGRAPDYDDWKLNGDILVYYPVLDIALELSSMGIRVNAEVLAEQLKKAGCEERAELPFQKDLLEGRLPQTIGGGIGQSRICMFFLRKAHIGEIQVSVWPDEIYDEAAARGITIL